MTQLARRSILTGLASLPLAALLADPKLARAVAAGLEEVSINTKDGRSVEGALAVPDATPVPAVLLIHEWWGLNDQIKTVASELAKEGYLALAVDLYGGKVADTPEGAKALMEKVQPSEATDTLTSWIAWLEEHPQSTGKVATIGWCFGGGWSLNASLNAPVDATVIYYGRVNTPAEDLKSLRGPVLGHFATEDEWINEEMVGGFEEATESAGKEAHIYWYEADHAFANPTQARYDQEDAQLAWQRTLEFLEQNLKG